MILESGILIVKAGQGDAFAAEFRAASPIIRATPGYIRHELHQCMETPDRFLLLVWWETLEAHTVGFRGSPQYQEWRARLHPFYEPFPTIEHFTQVDLTPPEGSAAG
jgi:heme-degrading monooxygenase HmoA